MLASAVRVGGCALGSRAALGGGGVALVPLSCYPFPEWGSWRLPWCPFPLCLGPRSCPFLVLGWFAAPMLCLLRRPVPMGACPHLGPLRALLPECPLLSLALLLPLSLPFLVWWWRGGEGALMAGAVGVGGLEPLAEGSGGVGGAEALDRISEEGLPCRLRHDGLQGGLVGVGGVAGAHLLEVVHHVRWSSCRGMPFLGVGRGVCRCALFHLCFGPRSCPFLVLGWFAAPMLCLLRRPVPMGACPHLGPLRALLPECPLLSLALPLPLSFPFLVWWWDGWEGALMAQAWGWVARSHWRRALGV